MGQRVATYELLQLDYTTPLFRSELLYAMKLHQEVLDRPDPTVAEQHHVIKQLVELDKTDSNITDHWQELHKSVNFRSALFATILGYQEYLTAQLLHEYAGFPIPDSLTEGWHQWLADRGKEIEKHDNAAVDEGERERRIYRQTIVVPLKEMMLNQKHVEEKIKTATVSRAGYAQHLVDARDWPKLANMLVNDRELALTMFDQKPLYENVFNDAKRKLVLRKLDEIQHKYFEELTDSNTYAISKYAKEVTSGTLPNAITAKDSRDASALAAAKGIYNKVVARFGFGGRAESSLASAFQSDHEPNSSSISLSSTAPLMNARKQGD